MTESKKKGIYLKPVSVEDLTNKIYAYMAKEKDFKGVFKILEDSKKEVEGTLKEKMTIRNAKLFRGGLDAGILLSFYHMGGSEDKTMGGRI